MTNIAQTINVLQTMILTKGSDILLTPTYHVYEMYTPHQGADSVPCQVKTDRITFETMAGKSSLPRLAGSCSRTDDGITLSLVNTHVSEPVEITVDLRGVSKVELESWRVLTSDDIHDHNTFEEPENVRPIDENITSGAIELQPASVNVLSYSIDRSYG